MPPGRPWEYDAPVEQRPSAPWAQDEEVVGNFPGKEASFSQGKPQAWYEGAWESVRNSIFGTPERAEAMASGDLLSSSPTPADMANYAVTVGSLGASAPIGAAVGATLGRVRGPIGAAARWLGAHPRTATAATGALPGALEGDVSGAAKGAAVGAVLGAGGKSAADMARKAKDLLAAGKAGEARAILEAIRQMGAAEAPAVSKTVVPAVTSVVDKGRAAAGAHKALMDFAKEAVKENPKLGQKIWMLLDDSGAPTKLLTPDQAGAAARKGLKTTWVRNLWGGSI